MFGTDFTSPLNGFSRTRLTAIAAVLTIITSVPACDAQMPPHGELGENQRILATCDKAAPPASDIQIDATGSSASKQLLSERMTAATAIVRKTAICSGQLRVRVFSSSSSATMTLFEGPLRLDGATSNARLKRAPRVVVDVMAKIRNGYVSAANELYRGGSDIIGVYRLSAEWIAQLGATYRLHLFILTDGFQNVGIRVGTKPLSQNEARALADRVTVPKLPHASVQVAGLGRVAGKPPRSTVVEGLVAFYTALCHKTGAADCLAVTDYATKGK